MESYLEKMKVLQRFWFQSKICKPSRQCFHRQSCLHLYLLKHFTKLQFFSTHVPYYSNTYNSCTASTFVNNMHDMTKEYNSCGVCRVHMHTKHACFSPTLRVAFRSMNKKLPEQEEQSQRFADENKNKKGEKNSGALSNSNQRFACFFRQEKVQSTDCIL